MDRRLFLGGLSYWGLGLAGVSSGCATTRRPTFATNPFSLGVASGDPLPDGVVLWTRLAPDPLNGGGMPPERVRVEWEVASDESMSNVVRRGRTTATPDLGHSVHVEVGRLRPDQWYWYQFRAGSEESQVGRTRTAPDLQAPNDRLDFAFASCQHFETGFFTSLRHLSEEDIDLVIHLGDYIYENAGIDGRVRKHAGLEIESLDDYRNRYAQYKTDTDLQAAHAAFPWLVSWDDHEIDNNWAGAHSLDDPAEALAFLDRRANAAQAYYEHMPLRRASIPMGPDIRLYRSASFGTLATFFVLDTRQYRTGQPCGDGLKPKCPEVFSPDGTILGREQERWLQSGLSQSASRWNVLAQQVMIADAVRGTSWGIGYSMDKWSGYERDQDRLLDFLHDRRISNPIVLTGDIHSNFVNDLKLDFHDMNSPTVATEFVGTSLSSGGDGADTRPSTEGLYSQNPFVKFWNGQRGYVRCRVTSGLWTSDYRVVDYVTRRGSPISTRASFVVEEGRAGVERA